MHIVGEPHDTESRLHSSAGVRGAGNGCTIHRLPFQRSAFTNGGWTPTAVHDVPEGHETALVMTLVRALDHLTPFHCSTSGRSICPSSSA